MQRPCHDRRLIGEILVERGEITRAHLNQALALQKAEGRGFIGDVLVRLGHIHEIEVVTALVLQCNLPYIAVSRHDVDPRVAAMIPSEMARRERLVPLDRIGNILSVVMQNPLDEVMRADVERLTGCCIATFISTTDEIERALNRIYPQAQEKT